MTVNYISPRSHSIAKSSGTLHMAQVGALRLAKALLESCRPLWHWYPKIYSSWINSPTVTTSPNTPASSREKRQYFSLGFGRKKTQRQRGYRSPKPFSTPKLLTVRSQYQGKNIAFFLMFVFFSSIHYTHLSTIHSWRYLHYDSVSLIHILWRRKEKQDGSNYLKLEKCHSKCFQQQIQGYSWHGSNQEHC